MQSGLLKHRLVSSALHTSVRRGLRSVAVRASDATESPPAHASYLAQVASVDPPPNLEAMLRVLQAQDHDITRPGDRAGLHPYFLPIATARDDATCVTGLLRWPDPQHHKGLELPVVRMTRDSLRMSLLARNVDEFITRQLLEEDRVSGPGPVSSAVGDVTPRLYKPGAWEASSLPTFEAFVVRNVAMYPDVVEQLSRNHRERGDDVSSLVAAEWATKMDFFPGFGRAFEFASEVYADNKRDEESRDMARVALRLPWWTLESEHEVIARQAGLEGLSAGEIRDGLNNEEGFKSKSGVNVKPEYAIKSDEQIALEDSYFLLNQVVAGEEDGYEPILQRLEALLLAAGCEGGARYVSNF